MINRFKSINLSKKHLRLAGIVVLILSLPLTLILVRTVQDQRSSAALPDKLEAETGVLSSSGVSKQSDSNVSGGQFVLFGKSITPTPSQSGYGPRGTVGPRYDFYDGKPGGNFPALGVLNAYNGPLYSGSPVTWNSPNVRIVPDSVFNASDQAAALSAWLQDKSKVPDGASAANPTFVVFDRSHNNQNSIQYGNGTEYNLNKPIHMGLSGVKRTNIVLWGYNTRLNFSSSTTSDWPPGLIDTLGGGWENFHVVGFEIDGPSSQTFPNPAHTPDMRKSNTTENHAGLEVNSWYGFKFLDNYVHHVSELLNLRNWKLDGNEMYNAWPHGPYNKDAEIGWNEMYWSMNQGLNVMQGHDINIHHNHIHDVRQKAFNIEEPNYNSIGSPARQLVNLIIQDNKFGNWVWQIDLNDSAITQLNDSDLYDNFQILHNEFYGGYMGGGNPSVSGEPDCAPMWNAHASLVLASPQAYTHGTNIPTRRTTLTVRGNLSRLPQEQVRLGYPWHCANYTWGTVRQWESITITDNDFQNMSWRHRDIGKIIFERNGTSQIIPY